MSVSPISIPKIKIFIGSLDDAGDVPAPNVFVFNPDMKEYVYITLPKIKTKNIVNIESIILFLLLILLK